MAVVPPRASSNGFPTKRREAVKIYSFYSSGPKILLKSQLQSYSMHTTQVKLEEQVYTFIHHGDCRGPMEIRLPDGSQIKIPNCEALVEFGGQCLAREKDRELEDRTWRAKLGLQD
jgi:hypothetical protein